jgi:hypothetical protein
MNSQNILKFYGSKLDLRLDSSEFYDYELSKVDDDYNSDVLDLNNTITYTGLTIDSSLENFNCVRNTISLVEIDNTINDPNYIYSGLTVVLNYRNFTNHFNDVDFYYGETILNNDAYTFIGIAGETHYFRIYYYNEPQYIDPNLNQFTETDIINGFSTNIISCTRKLEDQTKCCPISPNLENKPWAYKFDTGAGLNNCSPILKRRTENGWSLDFIFNREGLSWGSGSVFYYIGVRGDDNLTNYADNNLSFQFTPDGRIKWVSIHYSGGCESNEYIEEYYTLSGITPTLCVTDDTKDFNITIVFDRYRHLTDCNIPNDGGWNDLIPDNIISNVTKTGTTSTQIATPNTSEVLNKKWIDERNKRLGILKIYLNGKPIYKLENWEEVIPSDRGIQPFIQSWGGGTGLMDNLHEGVCCFNIKSIKYYEEPLDFVHVKHNFLTRLNQYDFFICGISCNDSVIALTTQGLLTENELNLLTENNELLLY